MTGDVEQLRLVPGENPDEIVARAVEQASPIARWCLFSGGGDSTVLAHRCADAYDGLAWMDTGTAVPGVRDFIHEFGEWLGKPVRIMDSGDAFRTMVLGDERWWARYAARRATRPRLTIEGMGATDRAIYQQTSGRVRRGPHRGVELGQYPHGFPGPGAHGRAYVRLKERQIEALTRELKVGHGRRAQVLYLSGVRRDESRRRSKTRAITKRKAAVLANPLIDWTNLDMRRYRRALELPVSPADPILHRSGECNCGAFAEAGAERAIMRTFYRDWWDTTIAPLEAEAERLGIRWCRWGGYDVNGVRSTEESAEKPGMMCQHCPVQLGLGMAA